MFLSHEFMTLSVRRWRWAEVFVVYLSEVAAVPTRAPASKRSRSTHSAEATGPQSAREQRMRAIYQAHGEALYAFLLRVTFGQPQLAQDLAQETMLRAWRNLDGLADDRELVRSWL